MPLQQQGSTGHGLSGSIQAAMWSSAGYGESYAMQLVKPAHSGCKDHALPGRGSHRWNMVTRGGAIPGQMRATRSATGRWMRKSLGTIGATAPMIYIFLPFRPTIWNT